MPCFAAWGAVEMCRVPLPLLPGLCGGCLTLPQMWAGSGIGVVNAQAFRRCWTTTLICPDNWPLCWSWWAVESSNSWKAPCGLPLSKGTSYGSHRFRTEENCNVYCRYSEKTCVSLSISVLRMSTDIIWKQLIPVVWKAFAKDKKMRLPLHIMFLRGEANLR